MAQGEDRLSAYARRVADFSVPLVASTERLVADFRRFTVLTRSLPEAGKDELLPTSRSKSASVVAPK